MVAAILADDRASRTEHRDLSAWLADPETPESCLAGVVSAAFAWLGSRKRSGNRIFRAPRAARDA